MIEGGKCICPEKKKNNSRKQSRFQCMYQRSLSHLITWYVWAAWAENLLLHPPLQLLTLSTGRSRHLASMLGRPQPLPAVKDQMSVTYFWVWGLFVFFLSFEFICFFPSSSSERQENLIKREAEKARWARLDMWNLLIHKFVVFIFWHSYFAHYFFKSVLFLRKKKPKR